MNLIYKEEWRALVEQMLALGTLDDLTHLLHARRDGRECEKRTLKRCRDEFGEGGLADTRRPPQNERGDVARLEEFAEYAIGADQMLLADVFIYVCGA